MGVSDSLTLVQGIVCVDGEDGSFELVTAVESLVDFVFFQGTDEPEDTQFPIIGNL